MKRRNTDNNRSEYLIKEMAFHYDTAHDLLYLYKKNSKVHTTSIVGDFHLEFDTTGKIVSLEVLHAKDILSEFKISQDDLEHLHAVELKVVKNNSSLLLFIHVSALREEKSATIAVDISPPTEVEEEVSV
ncbi:MAG: DUF2283 domain-containing protein [Nanoarchaeota archaeon]